MKTPRPWNIANLFYSMDKDMGKGFDEGLALLKTNLEQKEGFTDGNKTKFKVERYDFPSTNFALIRQKVKWSDLSGFFLQHYPILFDAISKAGVATGGASSLIYEWDEKSHLADIAAAVPVPAGTKLDNDIITFQEIPASKALLVNYKGPYNNESEAYKAIRDYMRENSLKQKGPSIEQYISGPANESDSSRWLTKIVFLVE
jgi:effector-binding domain-containing protein